MVPVPYEFADETVTELTAIQAQIERSKWAPFDIANTQLLYCRSTPSVCLIYERAALEEFLDLRDGALLSDRANRRVLLYLLGGRRSADHCLHLFKTTDKGANFRVYV